MKRVMTLCVLVLTLTMALCPAALAADLGSAATAAQVCYPTSISRSEDGTELKKIYGEVMSNEHMAAFNTAKQAMDAMMNEVTTILIMCVNGEDPDTCNPHSCGGSCATCGGCH